MAEKWLQADKMLAESYTEQAESSLSWGLMARCYIPVGDTIHNPEKSFGLQAPEILGLRK